MKKLDEAKKFFEAANSRHVDELVKVKQMLQRAGGFSDVESVYNSEL